MTQGRYKGRPATPRTGDPFPPPTRPPHRRLLCTCLRPQGQAGTSPGCLETPGEGPFGQERRRKAASAPAARRDEAIGPRPPFPAYGGCGRGVMTSRGPLASPSASEAAPRWPPPGATAGRGRGVRRGCRGWCGFRGVLAPRRGLLRALKGSSSPPRRCLPCRPALRRPPARPRASPARCRWPRGCGLSRLYRPPPGPFSGVLLTRRAPP